MRGGELGQQRGECAKDQDMEVLITTKIKVTKAGNV